MTTTIFKEMLEPFNAFMRESGQVEVNYLDKVEDEVFDKFIENQILQMGNPIVINPSNDELQKLGRGAVVAILVGRVDTLPRCITVSSVNIERYDYCTEDGYGREDSPILLSTPMLSYLSTGEEKGYVDPITNTCSVNAGHVVAIFDYGTPPPPIRNYMHYSAENSFIRRISIHRRDRADGSTSSYRTPSFGMWVFNEIRSKRWLSSISKGQYLGNLFELSYRILEGIPGLDIEYSIDAEMFSAAYEKAGKPGWVKQYRRPYWPGEEGEYKDLPMGEVNIKAFRKWVLRNYKRFTPGSKQLHREAIARCLQSERADVESYKRDMEYEFSRDSDETSDEIIAHANNERDLD